MPLSYRKRRVITGLFSILILLFSIITNSPIDSFEPAPEATTAKPSSSSSSEAVLNDSDSRLAIDSLKNLAIKGRAPKTNYSRTEFGAGWSSDSGCDTRNIILNRDLTDVVSNNKCEVLSGALNDPYTGTKINFVRGSETSADVQIDHVVALGDAWQKGAQLLPKDRRIELSNDPLELMAVSGPANQEKGDGDTATWLPSNKAFRCQYVARQIAVKLKYNLWVTQAEHDAMARVLKNCPEQLLPNP